MFRHSVSVAQQLIPIHNTTVHKNKSIIAFNVANCWCFETPACHNGGKILCVYLITFVKIGVLYGIQ